MILFTTCYAMPYHVMLEAKSLMILLLHSITILK